MKLTLISGFMAWMTELNKTKNPVGEADSGGKMMSYVLDVIRGTYRVSVRVHVVGD